MHCATDTAVKPREPRAPLTSPDSCARGEEIIPLAALMGLPGSTKGATAEQPYAYADNPWRGASVAPLGSNIQWDVLRKGDTLLVRMLYSEKETAFRAHCRPIARNSSFYDLDELQRCFGRTDSAS